MISKPTGTGLRCAAPLLVAAAALGVLFAIGEMTGVSGQTPTPTEVPTASPTPTAAAGPTPSAAPQATPYPQTTITIRFVRDGQPAVVALYPSRTSVGVGDVAGAQRVDCSELGTLEPADLSQVSIKWPRPLGQGFAGDCTKGPPTTLHFAFVTRTRHLNPFGITVTWTGVDLTADLEVPADIPLVAATPASVPSTGGEPDPGGAGPWAIVAGAIGAIIASVFVAIIVARRPARRDR